MKAFEEAFSSSGFRRVVLPGIVLTAGVHPLLKFALTFLKDTYGIDANVLIIIEVILFGLVVSSAIQWIYYLYEGFRARWLTAWAGVRLAKRLTSLERRLGEIQSGRTWEKLSEAERNEASKIYEELQDFPLEMGGKTPQRYCERPTRLGNVIAAYELYPQSRYAIEDIQFWNHLIFLAPGEARKEFDEQYAFAESLVLTSFSGIILALLYGLLLAVQLLSRFNPSMPAKNVPGTPLVCTVFCVAGLLVWLGFYKAAVLAHREAGATMRSLVDLAFPAFVEWTLKMKAAQESDEPEWRSKLGAWLRDLRE